MSSVRADCGHEEAAIQSTPRRRATRSAAPTPPEAPALLPSLDLFLYSLFLRLLFGLFLVLFLGAGDLVGQHAQLPLVEHRTLHHADQNLFDRAVAEPVDDALHGFRRHSPARFGRLVDIGSAIDR